MQRGLLTSVFAEVYGSSPDVEFETAMWRFAEDVSDVLEALCATWDAIRAHQDAEVYATGAAGDIARDIRDGFIVPAAAPTGASDEEVLSGLDTERAALILSFADLESLHAAVAGVVTANERWAPDEEDRWGRLGEWLARLAIAANECFPASWKGLPPREAASPAEQSVRPREDPQASLSALRKEVEEVVKDAALFVQATLESSRVTLGGPLRFAAKGNLEALRGLLSKLEERL